MTEQLAGPAQRVGELDPAAHAHHDVPDAVDARVRALLASYVVLAGAKLAPLGLHREMLMVPPEDRAVFGRRATVRIAWAVEALEEDPDAEMAVLGSAFVDQLIAAVRRRGTRRDLGAVGPSISPTSAAAALTAPVLNGTSELPRVVGQWHPVGRLTARVALRAGASVEERLVDSGLFDLATGAALSDDVAEACETATHLEQSAEDPAASAKRPGVAAARPVGELVPLMLGDLERRLAPDVERQREAADRTLKQELARIERYYDSLLNDPGGRGGEALSGEARRAVVAEHQRRRQEEIERHEVRATVHPVQLTRWLVPVQRAEWRLVGHDGSEGHAAVLVGERPLVGAGAWTIACPACGSTAPAGFIVCRHDHVACAACGTTCTVCTAGFCQEHGAAACHVDDQPVCHEHSRVCVSCRQLHCSAHEGTCADRGHAACTTCLSLCAHCHRVVCGRHATQTLSDAPRGARRLCAACVRYCEGGTSEIVGPDEVTHCATCARAVCERHQTTCAVDRKVHCSRHIRRTHRSRRLVCERDQASCVHEPNALFARDEVGQCATCEQTACAEHTGTCTACPPDGRRHCKAHLRSVRDLPGALACSAHVTTCHVDGASFSPNGTAECPVCAKRACATHRKPCASCGRAVCHADFGGHGMDRECTTCRRLAALADPDDRLIMAAIAAQGDGQPDAQGARGLGVKAWRGARDATHTVVELDLGWTRRLVLAVRHGMDRADVIMSHSILGSRRRTR